MNDIELIDEIVRRADEHQKQKEREFAIAELEKIKAEISDYAVVDDSKSIKRGFEIMQGIVLELLDNHISELKGENNEIKRTNSKGY